MHKRILIRWKRLSIVRKFTVAFSALCALIASVSVCGFVVLASVSQKADKVVDEYMLLQRIAVEMELHLLQARHAEKDFLANWKIVGFDEAESVYANRCANHIRELKAAGSRLKKFSEENPSILEGSAAAKDLDTLFTLANEYGESFDQSVQLVYRLGDESLGLRVRMDDYSLKLDKAVRALGSTEITFLWQELGIAYSRYSSWDDYVTASAKMRPYWQAFRNALRNSVEVNDVQREQVYAMMDELKSLGIERREIDILLAKKIEESLFRSQSIAPIVQRIIDVTTGEVQGAKTLIHNVSNMGSLAFSASAIVAFLLAVFILRLAQRYITQNAVRLAQVARKIGDGDLEARAVVRTDDEFGLIAESINSMADRLQTSVHQLEAEAKRASGRFVEAIENLEDGFAFYDADDKLVLGNRRYAELGYLEKDLIRPGNTFENIVRAGLGHGLYPEAVGREEEWLIERMKRHKNPGEPFEQEQSDGCWLLIREAVTRSGERLSILTDITAQKRAEATLAEMNLDLEEKVRERTRVLVQQAGKLREANQRLMELDRMKSNFLSTVSHELRTPLTSLLGFAKLIRRDFARTFGNRTAEDLTAEKVSRRILSNLSIIDDEGARLTRLINDVLDLSRIESGKVEWRDAPLDIAELLHAAVRSVSGQFAMKRGVELIEPMVQGELPTIVADPDRILQVLINLLNNAAKFTDAGVVSMEAARDRQGFVRITIRDTGTGIDEQHLESIFDKFQQGNHDDTLKVKPGGSGLGLAICRQIVEHYNGYIRVESTRRQGSAFHVFLPYS